LGLTPDGVADASFQRAQRFLLRFALSEFAVVVGAARRVVRDLGDGDEMHRVVQFAVPARVEPMPDTRSAGCFDRHGAVVGGQQGGSREAGRVTGVRQDQPGNDRADTMNLEQCRVRRGNLWVPETRSGAR
jgi:hypothetical protein